MHGRTAATLVALLALLGPGRARGQDGTIPHAQDRPPGPALSPAEAIRKMQVPEGFTVELVASEPDLVNPVAMTFDERGRAWVTESLEYPRREAGPGRDRVKVLEDTDGDGKADKFTVFAEGLNIPSGIAVGHGGVWVANSPDILFLKDTDGDGKADTREVVVSGFGRDDTHELPNSLTWGPDGWLYGWNGVFNRSVVKHRGKTFDFTCAIFRINPRTRDFELFCEGTSNPWGIAFNLDGEAFASACVIDHLWHLTETGYYIRQGGPYPPFIWPIGSIVDHKHQKAAYCGIHFFDSDAYPPQYREKLVMGNIHGNCVNLDRLEKNGSTYACKGQDDFLTANDAWFMPVVQKTGPDGCLYILDWYDRYHCYQDANRDPAGIDRLKGRLYRVRYKDTPRRAGFDLAKQDDDGLIGLLGSANVYDRDIARRLLVERGHADAKPKLAALVKNPSAPRKARMEAIFTLASQAAVTGTRLDPDLHLALLSHEDPGYRAWGARAAGNTGKVEPKIRDKVLALAHDPSPEVRLQVAIAARKLGGVDAIPVLLDVLSSAGDDRLIPQIVWQNLHPLLEMHGERFASIVGHDGAKKWSAGLKEMMPRIVDRLLRNREPAIGAVTTLLKALADGPNADDGRLEEVINGLSEDIQDGEIAQPTLAALRTALDKVLTRADDVRTAKPVDLSIVVLRASWKDREALSSAATLVGLSRVRDDYRARALGALIAAGETTMAFDAASHVLADEKGGSTELRGDVIELLGRLDDARVADLLLAQYDRLAPDLRPRAIDLLTERPVWVKALIAATAAKRLPPSALTINHLRKLQGLRDPELARQVKATWGAIREGRSPERERVIGQMRDFLRNNPGDPYAGQQVFTKLCAQCHKIYGEGQDVGPEVTLNGRNDFEQLLSNVFDPSLVIGEAYQATTVATTDGRVLTGLLAEDSPQRLVLKVQGGKRETVARAEVDAVKVSHVSLMPEDVEKQLQPQEIADLFAFLCLDKPPADPSAKQLPGAPPMKRRETPGR